ncbi:unnamed protein product [Caretta caretta]
MTVPNISHSCSGVNSVWCSNSSNQRHGQEQNLSPTGHLITAICLGIIGTLGFLNNLLVLILFCRNKVLQSPINLLLMNISVSDMMVCIMGTPFSFAASTQGRWLIGPGGCIWYGFINTLFEDFDILVKKAEVCKEGYAQECKCLKDIFRAVAKCDHEIYLNSLVNKQRTA